MTYKDITTAAVGATIDVASEAVVKAPGPHLRPDAFVGDERGVAAVEFALVAPVFLFMLLGFFDVGHTVFMRSVLQGAVQEAGRRSALESGPKQQDAVDSVVTQSVKNLAAKAEVKFDRKNYFSLNDVSRPEAFTDSNGDGKCNANEAFEDENDNQEWDTDAGSNGIGGPQDVVKYTVTVTYPALFSFGDFSRNASAKVKGEQKDTSFSLPGLLQKHTISATTILRNQPFGIQPAETIDILNCV